MMEIITVRQMAERNAEKFRSAVAFQVKRDGKYRKFTYREVFEKICGLQKKLSEMGVGAGDRVALLSENRPEWPISYLAIAGMGAVAVPLDAMLKKEEILPLLEDSGPKVFILSVKFTDHAKGTKAEGRTLLMEEFEKIPNSAFRVPHPVNLDDLAAIVYTSGTTGSPKGVMLTHRNIMSNAIAGSSCFELGPGDNFLSVLPLHHTFETTVGFLVPFYSGCTVTYTESLKSYVLIQNMQETGVTLLAGVPLLFQLLFDGIMREVEEQKKEKLFALLFSVSRFFRDAIGVNIGKLLFSVIHKKFGGKIRFFVSGGAAIDPDLIRNFDLMGFTIYQGYGLTESAPVLTACNPKANRIGSVGRPLPGVEIKIAGHEPVGEILGRGPNIMKGYYKRRDLTDKVIINGWLWTGDLGYRDEDGYVFITGRSKDIIVTGAGVNVYPEELEFVLKKNPAFKEVCILGDKVREGIRKGTEEVVAVIVPNTEFRGSVAEEIEKFNAGVADYKRIARHIIRKEELPKTRLMKTKRFELRKELGI